MHNHLNAAVLLAGILAIIVPLSQAYTYDPDYLIQDLYDRISQLEDNEDVGYPADDATELEPETDIDPRSDWAEIPIDSRDLGQADLRDKEFLEQPSKWGYQYISGGAGEGDQHLTPEGKENNTQETKSDEALPFYCHPPNPCPKGFTEKDGCDPVIQDNADVQKKWINDMQAAKKCACDEEHMFSCNKDGATVNSQGIHKDALDEVLESLLQDKTNNPYGQGEKRRTVVAKKSPIVKREAELMPGQGEMPFVYQAEKELKRVAKKGDANFMM